MSLRKMMVIILLLGVGSSTAFAAQDRLTLQQCQKLFKKKAFSEKPRGRKPPIPEATVMQYIILKLLDNAPLSIHEANGLFFETVSRDALSPTRNTYRNSYALFRRLMYQLRDDQHWIRDEGSEAWPNLFKLTGMGRQQVRWVEVFYENTFRVGQNKRNKAPSVNESLLRNAQSTPPRLTPTQFLLLNLLRGEWESDPNLEASMEKYDLLQTSKGFYPDMLRLQVLGLVESEYDKYTKRYWHRTTPQGEIERVKTYLFYRQFYQP